MIFACVTFQVEQADLNRSCTFDSAHLLLNVFFLQFSRAGLNLCLLHSLDLFFYPGLI